jgi:hypothetical protein
LDQIRRPLLATLLSPWLAEFAASIILFEDAKCEIAALSNTCGLHMILRFLSQDEESSGSFSSFHAKPISETPHFRQYQFQMPKTNLKQALIPACLGHDDLFFAVVMLIEDVP